MARMLGRYQVPWSRRLRSGKRGCGECEMGWPYGRSRRIPKRREQRAVRIVIEEESRRPSAGNALGSRAGKEGH